MYRDGYGIEPSVAKAEKWFSAAAAQKEPWSCYSLAELYEARAGEMESKRKSEALLKRAYKLYKYAADLGNENAQERLKQWQYSPVWIDKDKEKTAADY